MSFHEIMKTTGAKKRGTEKIGRSGQNTNLTPSGMNPETIANGSGQMEITPMHGNKDQDESPGGTASLLDSLNDPLYEEGGKQ